jgi:hypothetical protein
VGIAAGIGAVLGIGVGLLLSGSVTA